MKRMLLGLLLALLFLFPAAAFGQGFIREQEAFIALPNTTVAAVGTTTTAELDGSSYSSAWVDVHVSTMGSSNTVRLHMLVYEPLSNSFISMWTEGVPTSVAGHRFFCFSVASLCGESAAGELGVDIVDVMDPTRNPFPRRFKFSISTTNAASTTFGISVMPFNSP